MAIQPHQATSNPQEGQRQVVDNIHAEALMPNSTGVVQRGSALINADCENRSIKKSQRVVPTTTPELPRPPVPPPPNQTPNSIVQIFRDQDLGRTLLTFVIPITTGALSLHANHQSSPHLLPRTSLLLCTGLAALWNGAIFRPAFPKLANFIEQLGVASVFGSFFYVIHSFLPPNLAFIPWLCFLFTLIPSILTFMPLQGPG